MREGKKRLIDRRVDVKYEGCCDCGLDWNGLICCGWMDVEECELIGTLIFSSNRNARASSLALGDVGGAKPSLAWSTACVI